MIAGVYPRSGQVINAEDVSSLEIRATVYDVGSGLADVQIRLDGLAIDQPEAEIGADTDLAPPSQGVIAFSPGQLDDGIHLLTVYAKDNLGNQTTFNSEFVVDTGVEPPSLQPQLTFLNQTEASIGGQAEPNAIVTLFVNNQPAEPVTVGSDGNFTLAKVDLNEGANELYVLAMDSAGNESSKSESVVLTVDLQPPTVGNPKPSPNQRTQSQMLQMSVELSDNPGGSATGVSIMSK